MDILGVGPLELLVILILALVIFGPDKLPEMGAKLGKSMRRMRKATHEFSQEIEKARQALDPDQEISGTLQELGGAAKGAAASAGALVQAGRNPGLAIRDAVMQPQVHELKPQLTLEEAASPVEVDPVPDDNRQPQTSAVIPPSPPPAEAFGAGAAEEAARPTAES